VASSFDAEIARLAAVLSITVTKDTPRACFSSPGIESGAPLSGFSMVGALRLAVGRAAGVVAHGWLDYKDTCKANGIPWEGAVFLTHPDQIARCEIVLVGRNAERRADWRQWAAKIPRTRDHIEGLLTRTAAPDLTVSQLATICGVSRTTARRYVADLGLPYRQVKQRGAQYK
jgi:hypothetical protein